MEVVEGLQGGGRVTPRTELIGGVLQAAHRILSDNVRGVTLSEALFVPQGGYRSIMGTLKHAAGWSRVYRSFAFDESPLGWEQLPWPRGLRDTIEPAGDYLDELRAWLADAHASWTRSMAPVTEVELDELRPLHWGDREPLWQLVLSHANHDAYHAGEINQLLSIARGEAWEEFEEVEENHVSTVGHRVRPAWMGPHESP